MKRSPADRAAVVAVLAALVFTVAAAVIIAVSVAGYRPSTGPDVSVVTDDTTAPSESGQTETQPPAGTGPIEKYNILCLGRDPTSGLCDTVILVNLSTDGGIAAMQIPRDTYVRVGGEGRKLNSAFSLLGQFGPGSAAELLSQALCVRIDFTVVISTEAFREAVDALGGVLIDVPRDMDYDDPYQDLHIHLKAGEQLLDGRAAEHFVRFRSGYADGDLGRLDAQKIFLSALTKTVRENLTLEAAAGIINRVLPLVKTDMSAQDALFFARAVLSGAGSDGPVMLTAPGRAINSGKYGLSFYVLGRSATLKAVNSRFNVYENEITDASFDPDEIFCEKGDDDFERIYRYSLITVKTGGG